MTVSAVRPWRNALRRERSLPSGVVGPVLLSAFRRLASICLRELIDDQRKELASFRHLAGPVSRNRQRRFRVRLFPKSLGDVECIDLEILPPSDFVACL